ncbi:right-handed parallel beta-helix repeat-containing protein [Embleya sp. AB8]|uniref:right-handed parallel beta-helix repeat-containing protein n=1 Tax=Embleya sp. AB8 TaxID=3156304 RepID=UPI003C76DE95
MHGFRPTLALAATVLAATAAITPTAGAATGPTTTGPTTTYVDCGVGRLDAGGTTPEDPLGDLTPVNAHTYQPGDRILLRAGTVCTGTLQPEGNGTAGNPITIGAYGDGPRPLIQGTGGPSTVRLVDQSWWTVQGLHITNPAPTQALRTGVQIDTTTPERKYGIVVRDLEVSDVAGWSDKTGANAGWFSASAGIVVLGKPTAGPIEGITIADNQVHDTGGGGIKISVKPADFHRDVLIRANTIRSVGGDGIVVHGSDAPLVEYNLFDDGGGGKYPYLNGNFAGMWPINSRNPVFQYNEVTRQRPSIFDSTAWDCDGAITGSCTYQYNYSHDNGGGFYLGCENCTALGNFHATQILRFNIAQDDCRIRANASGDNTSPLRMYNNTFFCPSKKLDVELPNGPAADTLVANNVFVAGQGALPTGTGVGYQANVYSGGFTAPSGDASAVTTDPGLAAPGTATGRTDAGGYALLAGSPALGSGVAVPDLGSRDYFGNAVTPVGVNRGAYNGPAVDAPLYPSIAAAYNNVAVGDDANPNTGGFGLSGRSYSGQALAAAGYTPGGTVGAGGAGFTWHPRAYGLPDNVKVAGQRIALTGSGSRLVVLGAGAYGAQSGTVTVTYTDGSSTTATLALGDWWSTVDGPADQVAVRAAYHHKPQTDYRTPASARSEEDVTVRVASLAIDPSRTVASVTLPAGSPIAGPGLHVFDLKVV